MDQKLLGERELQERHGDEGGGREKRGGVCIYIMEVRIFPFSARATN